MGLEFEVEAFGFGGWRLGVEVLGCGVNGFGGGFEVCGDRLGVGALGLGFLVLLWFRDHNIMVLGSGISVSGSRILVCDSGFEGIGSGIQGLGSSG